MKKDNKILRQQVKTLEGHKRSADSYIENSTEGMSLEAVLTKVEENREAKKISKNGLKNVCRKCFGTDIKIVPMRDGKSLELCAKCGGTEVLSE